MAEKTLEKVSLSNCDLRSLQNQHSLKQQNLSYLSYKEKKHLTGAPKNTFLCKLDTCLKLPWQGNFFEEVFFSNCYL